MADVVLRKVVKRFDEVEAVRGIDLDIPDKEFVVLVGPSGCGKSTTLRMIAGLEDASGGEIYIDGALVNDVPPKDRDIAMVFQNYALYPHMTVFENMSFGLRLRRAPRAQIRERVEHAARILDIMDLLDRRPKQLSGGQRQRVAMGRAIVRNPKVFLFDEPLSNLDAKLRVQMRTEIKRVHQKVKTTTVYVTHDQVEAMTLADRVVVMNAGSHRADRHPAGAVPQAAHPLRRGVHRLTCDEFRALSSRSQRARARASDSAMRCLSPCRRAALHATNRMWARTLVFGLRPEHITDPRYERSELRPFTVTLDVVEPMGMETMVYFKLDGAEVCGRVEPGSVSAAGQPMRLCADLNQMHLIDPQTDLVL